MDVFLFIFMENTLKFKIQAYQQYACFAKLIKNPFVNHIYIFFFGTQ